MFKNTEPGMGRIEVSNSAPIVKWHLHVLDSLRGFAALSVCLFHYSQGVLPKVHVDDLLNLFCWGSQGVRIFFAISGFIIPYVLITGNYTLKSFWSFIGKRLVRICPPSYVVIILALLQWWINDHILHTHHAWFVDITPIRTLHNFLYTIPFTKYEWYNGIFWTLSVEIQYYIFLGLFFTWGFKSLNGFLIFSLVSILLAYVPNLPIQSYFSWSSLFLMGGLTALYFVGRINLSKYLIVLASLYAVAVFQIGVLDATFAGVTCLIISFVSFDIMIGRFFGKISYSLYLTHIICAPVFETLLIKFLPFRTNNQKILVFILCVLGVIGFSYLFYLLVEKLFIRISSKLFNYKQVRSLRANTASALTV